MVMDILFLILFLLGIGCFIFGLSLVIGFGWAMVIFDIVTHQVTSTEYSQAQKDFPSAKTKQGKLLGLLLLVLTLPIIYFLVTKF